MADLQVRKGVTLSAGWSWKASWRKATQTDSEGGAVFREVRKGGHSSVRVWRAGGLRPYRWDEVT